MSNPVAAFFSCLRSGDVTGALTLVHENGIFEAQGPSSIPIYGTFSGHEGVQRFLAILSELFDTEEFRFDKCVEVDSYVFACGYMQHRVKKTRRTFQCEWALICKIENGLIMAYKMFEDTAALQAAYA